MADQSVRITDMPSAGSREEVAYKLWRDLSYSLPDDGDWKERINRSLDLYATCLSASSHARQTRL